MTADVRLQEVQGLERFAVAEGAMKRVGNNDVGNVRAPLPGTIAPLNRSRKVISSSLARREHTSTDTALIRDRGRACRRNLAVPLETRTRLMRPQSPSGGESHAAYAIVLAGQLAYENRVGGQIGNEFGLPRPP